MTLHSRSAASRTAGVPGFRTLLALAFPAVFYLAFLMHLGAFTPLLSGDLMPGTGSYSSALQPYSFLRQGLFALLLGYVLVYRGAAAVFRTLWLAVIVFAYFGLTVLWSAYRADSLRAYVFFLTQLISAVCICVARDDRDVPKSLAMLMAAVVAALVLSVPLMGVRAFESHGYVGALRGPFYSKNQMGPACAFAVGVLFTWVATTGIRRSGVLPVVAGGVAAILLLWTQSITSLLTCVLSLGCGWALTIVASPRVPQAQRAGRTLAFALLAPALAVGGKALSGGLLTALGRTSTLTGRDFIWDKIFPLALEKFAFGYGFGGFWQRLSSMGSAWLQSGIWFINQAHNGFLEAMLHGGAVGLALVVGLYLYAGYLLARAAVLAGADGRVVMGAVLLVQALLGSFTESTFPNPGWETGSMLCVAIVLLRAAQPARATTGAAAVGARFAQARGWAAAAPGRARAVARRTR